MKQCVAFLETVLLLFDIFVTSVQQMDLTCNVVHCKCKFYTLQRLISHLKLHISNGLTIKCPFTACACQYSIISSFSAHISRKHSCTDWPIIDLEVANQNTINPETAAGENVQAALGTGTSVLDYDEPDMITLTQAQYASIYMKMQYQLLIPDSTVSEVIEKLGEIATKYEQFCRVKILKKILIENRVDHNKIDEILSKFSEVPSLQYIHMPLKTTYLRKQFFLNNFAHVLPMTLKLNLEVTDDSSPTFQYIPILQTISLLFKDAAIKHGYLNNSSRSASLLEDFCDGQAYKSNVFFQSNTSALQFILYQDSFEVVNPLGSAKKKHKILAVYCTLGNLPAYLRSKVNIIQLVLLCEEKHLTSLSSYKSLFSPLIRDLKKLESEGINVGIGKSVCGTVAYISGDNLGSHWLGGFVCNFSSSSHFCRYCHVSRNEFLSDPFSTGDVRTVTSYKAALQQLHQSPGEHVQGIKYDSVFNELNFYHVCSPGLPPCIGHDIFEGVLQLDFPLFFSYFAKHNWFDTTFINYRLKTSLRFQRWLACCILM